MSEGSGVHPHYVANATVRIERRKTRRQPNVFVLILLCVWILPYTPHLQKRPFNKNTQSVQLFVVGVG
jgi:hypothetical protein